MWTEEMQGPITLQNEGWIAVDTLKIIEEKK